MTNNELKMLCEQATPGEWRKGSLRREDGSEFGSLVIMRGSSKAWVDHLPRFFIETDEAENWYRAQDKGLVITVLKSADAAFIAAARTELPRLLAENERLREACESAAQMLKPINKNGPVSCSYGNCQGALKLLRAALEESKS